MCFSILTVIAAILPFITPLLAQTSCSALLPYPGMQYLTGAQLALYKLTNPCSVQCKPGYYGDLCTPVPAISTTPQGPWNEAGYYTSGVGVLQTMSLSVSTYVSQISFTSSDSLLVGLANQQYASSNLVMISLSKRQESEILSAATLGYMLDALTVRYGQVFIARAKTANGPYDISSLTGQLQVGPYSTELLMPIKIRAAIIEVFLDKGMNTTFVYTTTNNANQLYACYPNGTATLWLTREGVTGVVCGMNCPNTVYVSVQNTILQVTSTSSTPLVTNGVLSASTLINCITSAPELNTILYRTSTYVQQISIGTSANTNYNALLTLSNPTTECSQCCSLDISDSNALIILVENGIVNTVESMQQPCPPGTTSVAVVSTSAAACVACPDPPTFAYLDADSTTCQWHCTAGYIQIGNQCVTTQLTPCPPYFNAHSTGLCAPSPMPWAPAGSYLVSVNLTAESSTYATFLSYPASGLVKYPPYVVTAGGAMAFLGMTGNLYASPYNAYAWRVLSLTLPTIYTNPCQYTASNNYYLLFQKGQYLWVGLSIRGSSVQHCMWALNVSSVLSSGAVSTRVTQSQFWTLPSQVCSIAPGDTGFTYILLCDVNYVLQTQFAAGGGAGQFTLLTGQLESGYEDGPLSTALFSGPTSIVYYEQRLFVADTQNCIIREVDLIRSQTSTIAGVPGVCERENGATTGLLYPTNLSLTAFDGFLLFLDQGSTETVPTIRQLHADTGYVCTIKTSPMSQVTTLLGFTDRIVVLDSITGAYIELFAVPALCPNGTAALEGNAMAAGMCLTCGAGTFSNGAACLPCSQVSCYKAGQRPIQCSGNTNSYCGQCSNKPTSSPSAYTGPAQSYDGWVNCPWVYLPPCPVGYYQNQTVCVACPLWSTTQTAGATGISQCACINGNWAGVSQFTCVVPSPYTAMPQVCQVLVECPSFTQPTFPFPIISSCTSSALDSIQGVCLCLPGQYIAQIYPKVCSSCPSGLYSPGGQFCSQCPPYAVPAWDGSSCQCAAGTYNAAVATAQLICVCSQGAGYDPLSGCMQCLQNTFNADTLILSSTPWLQSKACEACPAGTWSARGQTGCEACAEGQYRDISMASCADCPSGQYATDATTELSCTACASTCNGLLQTPCPTDTSLYICKTCPPPRNFSDFNGVDNCATSCWDGYYELDGECVECTQYNSTSCPAGNYLIECSPYADSSCAPCVNATMPLYNSEWIPLDPDSDEPSLGCHWRCSEGYKANQIAWSGTGFAVWSCSRDGTFSMSNMFTV